MPTIDEIEKRIRRLRNGLSEEDFGKIEECRQLVRGDDLNAAMSLLDEVERSSFPALATAGLPDWTEVTGVSGIMTGHGNPYDVVDPTEDNTFYFDSENGLIYIGTTSGDNESWNLFGGSTFVVQSGSIFMTTTGDVATCSFAVMADGAVLGNDIGSNGAWAFATDGHIYFKADGAWVQKV